MSSLRPRVILLMNALLFLSGCGEDELAPFNFWRAVVAGVVTDSSGVAVPAFTVTTRPFRERCLTQNALRVESRRLLSADGSFVMNLNDASVGEAFFACLVIVVKPEIEGLRTDSIVGVLVRFRRTDENADTAKVHVVLPPAAP